MDFIKAQLAQLPTRREVWQAAMLGMLGGAVAGGHTDRGVRASLSLGVTWGPRIPIPNLVYSPGNRNNGDDP
jgi:hypothetical protein